MGAFDTEIIKECLSDIRLQSLFSIQEKLLKTQDHLLKYYNPRIFIGLLESLINEMQAKLHPDLEHSFSKIMELSLILSQIKNHTQNGETMNILNKMKDILSFEINGIISETIQKPKVKYENTLPKPADEKKDEEDDEYWSDFSDEDFDIEDKEEKEALNTLYHLQSWI